MVVVVVAAVYAWSARGTQLSVHTFMSGLPLLRGTVARMWPPAFDQLSVYADDAVQSVQIALMGTTLAALLALPVALLAARNLTRRRYITWPLRAVLNAARGISPLVFALLFVSVVGLGPFPGVLAVAANTFGVLGKFFADAVEGLTMEPVEAGFTTGGAVPVVISQVIWPMLLPSLTGAVLFAWEWNVRESAVLGIVGAGGIGYELKASIDLLDFAHLTTILGIIVLMVGAIDTISGLVRRRLL